jgi:hypothetical protein
MEEKPKPSDCIPELNKLLTSVGMLTKYQFIPIHSAPPVHNTPGDYLFRISGSGKRFILKTELDYWLWAGKYSKSENLEIQFNGKGFSINLDVYQLHMQGNDVPLVYWNLTLPIGQFYIMYPDEIAEYDNNAMDSPRHENEQILCVNANSLNLFDVEQFSKWNNNIS